MSGTKKTKMLFIYNPKAGKAMIKSKLADILDIFTVGGYEVTVIPTQKKNDAVEIMANRSKKFDIVVCSGGDGTLAEVVRGMLLSGFKTTLGYIPAGSTNDFAGSLGIPSNMIKAAKRIVEGETVSCDIGKFGDAMFTYVAAFGLFSEISYETDQQVKNALGHAAYVLGGAKSISNLKPYTIKVKSDGESFTDTFIYGMVSNSNQVGGFQGIMGRDVSLNDGKLEVTLIRMPANLVELNAILMFLAERNLDNEFMYSFHSSDVTFESVEGVPWSLDGEAGGMHEKIRVTVIPEAIEIRV